ncbi:MAG: LrgB family protein [Candidatus Thermoplasmatota archaeon]|nr:LrgB family protein [Candidatus Thermoplasmatota archaeon]MBS3789316.1 LrgB family protein [Candidatus Thermoplasmatota archaeon]
MNLLGIFLTISVYFIFSRLYHIRKKFYLNPVMLSITSIIILLYTAGIEYEVYMESARILSFLLGPAVVSLAIPLYKKRDFVIDYSTQISSGVIFGGLIAILSAFFIAHLLGGSEDVLLSISPKSVTTPIAIGVSEQVGGIPALTAILVIITGIMGNSIGLAILNLFRVEDRVARGLAMGVTSHGLGTARMIQEDKLSGAVSGLGMALNGVLTSLLLYYLIKILMRL